MYMNLGSGKTVANVHMFAFFLNHFQGRNAMENEKLLQVTRTHLLFMVEINQQYTLQLMVAAHRIYCNKK